ncbi:MAG: hypothetical protein MJ050_07575 [Phascolarctobacterium sp.]|nr:hypothetical protein [Phascolarctobacterium sp.]
MNNKGFFLLENLIVFTLGTLLLLTTLRIFDECLVTMQKKLLLEEALQVAEIALVDQSNSDKFQIITKELPTTLPELNFKEVSICLNEKIIFTITVAE